MIPTYLREDMLLFCEPILNNDDLCDAAWWLKLEERCAAFMDSYKIKGSSKAAMQQLITWRSEDE
jgi:hypothetical protein